jgi:hypothetical protein
MRIIFIKYMFFILTLLFLLNAVFQNENSFGLNKTVSWAYDISNPVFFSVIIYALSQSLFFIGYLLILILRRKTNFYISIAHSGMIILTYLSIYFENYSTTTACCFISIILFFINIFKTHK